MSIGRCNRDSPSPDECTVPEKSEERRGEKERRRGGVGSFREMNPAGGGTGGIQARGIKIRGEGGGGREVGRGRIDARRMGSRVPAFGTIPEFTLTRNRRVDRFAGPAGGGGRRGGRKEARSGDGINRRCATAIQLIEIQVHVSPLARPAVRSCARLEIRRIGLAISSSLPAR